MRIKLEVEYSNDPYARLVTVSTEPCEGYGFWNVCPSAIITRASPSNTVEFSLPDANVIYITISAPTEEYTWNFRVFKDGQYVTTVTVKGGYTAHRVDLGFSIIPPPSNILPLAIIGGLAGLILILRRRRKK
jgi:hypothetical protein